MRRKPEQNNGLELRQERCSVPFIYRSPLFIIVVGRHKASPRPSTFPFHPHLFPGHRLSSDTQRSNDFSLKGKDIISP